MSCCMEGSMHRRSQIATFLWFRSTDSIMIPCDCTNHHYSVPKDFTDQSVSRLMLSCFACFPSLDTVSFWSFMRGGARQLKTSKKDFVRRWLSMSTRLRTWQAVLRCLWLAKEQFINAVGSSSGYKEVSGRGEKVWHAPQTPDQGQDRLLWKDTSDDTPVMRFSNVSLTKFSFWLKKVTFHYIVCATLCWSETMDWE